MSKRHVAVLLSLSILAGAAARAAAPGQDQIHPWRGAPASGVIVETSPTDVTIDVRGSQRKFAVNEIRRVSFAGDPPELRRAREDILTGQIESGLGVLKRLDAASIREDLVRADLQYYIAYCQGKLALTGGGDKAAAATALLDFVKRNPKSHHFFEAAELLGDLALALESFDNAVKYYAALGRAPWPEYQMHAAVLEASALVAQGKFSEAQAKYESVVAFAVDTPEATHQKLLAQVGKAVCLAETGQPDQGVAIVQEIILKNDPKDVELFGRAYNALGRCHLKAKRVKDALLAYLFTDVLFNGNADAHAEALYHLSKLWGDVNKADRAVNDRKLLLERYPGSLWAKRS